MDEMRSSRVVRASDSQCRSRSCPGHSGIWGAADEAVSNKLLKIPQNPPSKLWLPLLPNLKYNSGSSFPLSKGKLSSPSSPNCKATLTFPYPYLKDNSDFSFPLPERLLWWPHLACRRPWPRCRPRCDNCSSGCQRKSYPEEENLCFSRSLLKKCGMQKTDSDTNSNVTYESSNFLKTQIKSRYYYNFIKTNNACHIDHWIKRN